MSGDRLSGEQALDWERNILLECVLERRELLRLPVRVGQDLLEQGVYRPRGPIDASNLRRLAIPSAVECAQGTGVISLPT